MNRLAQTLSRLVREKIDQARLAGTEEVRLIFHGPPRDILENVFDILIEQSVSGPAIPILLQLPALAPGQSNPPIGSSGPCDDTHLLNLRNSPSQPAFLALVPPGQHSMRSVTSTTDEFGVAAWVNGGNITFEDWWSDEFIQGLIAEGILQSGLSDPSQREEARALVENAAMAADDMDAERTQRSAAWRVISKLFSVQAAKGSADASQQLSLATGVPPMATGFLSAREQLGVLGKIADAMADGYKAGVDRAAQNAAEEDKEHLSAFYGHLRESCDLPTAFERATAVYYAPGRTLNDVPAAPRWWRALTAEKWSELLSEEPIAQGDIRVECSNSIIQLAKGMPSVVESGVELAFEMVGEFEASATVSVERGKGKVVAEVQIGGGIERASCHDSELPPHKAPLKYTVQADGFKPGSVKVVSLASWQPGIVVACRLARKLTLPKKPARVAKGAAGLETTLVMPGGGRYELLVFTSPGVELDLLAIGTADDASDADNQELPIRKVREGYFQLEVEPDGNYHLDIKFKKPEPDGKEEDQVCRVFLVVEDVAEQGCRSEFERLICMNRRTIDPSQSKVVVQLNRSARISSFQDWMLSREGAGQSYLPAVFADDYVDAWVQPTWGKGTGPLFSNGRFLHDPRPDVSEFNPPEGFIEARQMLAARIRGSDDQPGLVESALLGKWLDTDPDFKALLERYLAAYQAWISAEPGVACWVDVSLITSLESDRRTISRVPDAVMLSPMHPIRLAWQALAQEVLLKAEEGSNPCPAVSVLDPDCVPDLLTLSLRSPSGVEQVDFLSVENGTDYWSVLWNGDRLGSLPTRSSLAPFGDAFGISVGGISTGFSAAQVSRALEDVSGLLAAKPVVSILVASAGGTTDSCNEGLISWCSARYRGGEGKTSSQSAGSRFVEIYDDREGDSRPDDTTIANLSEDTSNHVRWFERQPRDAKPDLGIIAQLDMSEPSASNVMIRSPLGYGGLLRHRVRRQLPGAFLSESRQSTPGTASGDYLADKLAACIGSIESLGADRKGMRFAPNVNAVRHMLETRDTDFVAVSSSAIDPACFLGGWLENAYLWDYDMPSYSHRAGDTNGYYLLSKVKDADREGLSTALARIPGCGSVDPERVAELLFEIARRGIPTIKGLSGDDTGATGDLGVFVAVRLLQDSFRRSQGGGSLIPVIELKGEGITASLIVPVDPFRGYLSDLAKALSKDHKDLSLSRPDLIVIGIKENADGVRIHLTPVEVKCRPGSIFPHGDVGDALNQARTFSKLLSGMLPHEGQPIAWSLAFQHLLLSIVGFGMRVYSQHTDVIGKEAEWASLHERVAAAILDSKPRVSIDAYGRLVIVDNSARSGVKDSDNDGFEETITIGSADAASVISGDPSKFYQDVRDRVGQWSFFPSTERQEGCAVPVDAPPTPAHDTGPPPASPETAASVTGVELAIGTSISSFGEGKLSLNISDTRLNQLNMGVVGDLGTGKTQLLKSLIFQVSKAKHANRGIPPRFLIFDYKRDYSSDEFVQATGARVVKPFGLPLNLFDTSAMGESAAPWLDRFRFFADVLDKIYSGIGPVQRDKLKRAVKSAYDGCGNGKQPTLSDVHAAYADLLEGRVDSPMAIIDDLIDMGVFAAKAEDTIPFDSFLDGVVVISLDALGQDDRSKNMLVAVMLNMFYENMLKTKKLPFIGSDPQLRAINSFLLVDEADNIMRYEFDVLRKLLLQGREFGTGVILASQYLRHFKVNATDYREPLLTWFIHKVPNITAAELSALGLVGNGADLAERVKALQVHQCLYKSFDVPGDIVRGLPFFELER